MAINARSVITRLSLWLLITSGTPIQAQDICSVDGKKKLQAAEVSSAQIAKICPPTAQGGRLDQVHYREVKAAILDTLEAAAKNIALRGTYRGLSTLSGKATLRLKVDTDTSLNSWYVYFEKAHTDVVANLHENQRVAVVCRIRNLQALGPECDLIAWDRP